MADPVAVYRHEGCRIDYTPDGALAAGAVVDLGDWVGITTEPIAANALGSLAVHGVFEVAAFTGEEIAVGAIIYWDAGTNQASGEVSYSEAAMGYAVRAKAAADTTLWVLLCPGISGI